MVWGKTKTLEVGSQTHEVLEQYIGIFIDPISDTENTCSNQTNAGHSQLCVAAL